MTLIVKEKIIKEDLGPYRINYKSILQIASHSYKDKEDVRWAYQDDIEDGFLDPLRNASSMFVVESEQYFLSHEKRWVNFEASCNGRVNKKLHWNTQEYWKERNENFYQELKSIDKHNCLVDDLQEGVLYKAVIDANFVVPRIDKDLMHQTHDGKYEFKKVVNYADGVRFDYDVQGRRKWNNFHNQAEYIDCFMESYWSRNPEFMIKQKIESVN
tara:strand:+ start:75 stop:716 length:642 start_codon:yes stop_codon:yes gene_type:complete